MQPLTHHEILELIGPVCRAGRHVDLAASDRMERRIVFKPIDLAGTDPLPGVRETLVLEYPGAGSGRLVRLLSPAQGPVARVEAEGACVEEALARIEAVTPQRQLYRLDGACVAISLRVPRGPAGVAPRFVRGEAHLAGLVLTLETSSVKGDIAKVGLRIGQGAAPQLPQDALAVLGGEWSRLREAGDGWTGELRLRGREPQRSGRAEAAFVAAVQHLTQMLAERPARFHERWAAARWRVFLRRSVPLAGCIGLIAGAAAVPKLHLAAGSGLRMLILNAPPLLMILFFCLREIPIVEIPPVPRRSAAASWSAGSGNRR